MATPKLLGSFEANIYAFKPPSLPHSIPSSTFNTRNNSNRHINTSICPLTKRKKMKKNVTITSSLLIPANVNGAAPNLVLNQKSRDYDVEAVIRVRNEPTENMKERITQLLDPSSGSNSGSRGVSLQLVSTEVDLRLETMEPMLSDEALLEFSKKSMVEKHSYKVKFVLNSDFGLPGAIILTNNLDKEFFLEDISIDGYVKFMCKSWIQPLGVNSNPRVFFCDKAYLPSQTPLGLKEVRDKELIELRGNRNNGTRLPSDRKYNYDVYNDLGNPDQGIDFQRPTLGGHKFPHPRRCRTGRPPTTTEDRFWGLRDDEFGQRTLAGINPLSIQKLKVFPPLSKLDPSIYGQQESALREEYIIGYLDGMSVQEALEKNKLFMLDYHDVYMTFLDRINSLEGRKSYATRTVFFLTKLGTLKPIAIELSLPSIEQKSLKTQVLTPPIDSTSNWLWQLGKAHVCSNDAGVHQLVNHWLRTHAVFEPFIIGAHRQLSIMHPIFKLLHPHMRYTLKINTMARETLINAGGTIEPFFTPGRYSMEIVSSAYKEWWRLDLEGLPDDLIRRRMAEPDSTQPYGIRLMIEDYPYANDGLLIWSAIDNLVKTYVRYYYTDEVHIQKDTELQRWYNESVNVGHADICNAPWWPSLSSQDDLIKLLTTIIWITSAQHAAVNFGQYSYGGFVPNRPPLMRCHLPQENDPEYANFLADPREYFLASLPSLSESAIFIAILDILSTHSPDEEYIGERKDLSSWSSDPEIMDAFYKFSVEMKMIEKEIEKRNLDPKLRNRCGPGTSPYELLIPSSKPGNTGRGIPNSITI